MESKHGEDPMDGYLAPVEKKDEPFWRCKGRASYLEDAYRQPRTRCCSSGTIKKVHPRLETTNWDFELLKNWD
jgi:hypothetical protein